MTQQLYLDYEKQPFGNIYQEIRGHSSAEQCIFLAKEIHFCKKRFIIDGRKKISDGSENLKIAYL